MTFKVFTWRTLDVLVQVPGGVICLVWLEFNVILLKPTGYVMHQQFNIQQPYVLPTVFMCFVFI
jgi:hypothetical protein